MRYLVLLAITSLVLAGCGSSAGTDTEAPAQEVATGSETTSPAPGPRDAELKDMGTIVDSGLGQSEEFVWVAAIVRNNTDEVGQTLTVNFNVLDSDGKILKSEAQVSYFVRPQSNHIVATQVSLKPGEQAASLDPALHVEDAKVFSSVPFPEVSASEVFVEEDTWLTASFELRNPIDEPLGSPEVQVVCFDEEREIIGGGTDYPTLVPPAGTIKVDVPLIASRTPASCEVFVGAPALSGLSGTSTEGQGAESGSAAEAFETWVEQFNAGDWSGHYATLVTVQRDLIDESRYSACRSKEEPQTFRWVGVDGEEQVDSLPIPGTTEFLPATKVIALIEYEGVTVPVDAHMIDEDGVWKWSMTAENVAGCLG